MTKPFCYVAHKNGYWAGVTCPNEDSGKFLAEFIDDGFSITTCATREEYDTLLGGMQDWHKSPDYKAKHKKPETAQLDLLGAP